MPELPEVETIRRDLAKEISGAGIVSVEILDGRVVRQPLKELSERLKGRRIESVLRRGKALILTLDSGKFCIVQPMMTGQLVFVPAGTEIKINRDIKLIFRLSGGNALLYNDQRTFGRVFVVDNLEDVGYFRILGPEPFDVAFNPAYIRGMFKGKKRPIKTTLLDHTFVAGIGNIYACEILYRAGVSPKRAVHRLTGNQIADVHQQTVEVLREAIAQRGSSMRNYRDGRGAKGTFNRYIRVYARQGEPCLACGAMIKRIVQSGRSTFYCSICQK